MSKSKFQSSNVKWLTSDDKGTPARPLLGVIGPVFPFRGLRSSVSGLVFAVCRPPSSVLIITNTNNGNGHETLSEGEFAQQPIVRRGAIFPEVSGHITSTEAKGQWSSEIKKQATMACFSPKINPYRLLTSLGALTPQVDHPSPCPFHPAAHPLHTFYPGGDHP